MVPEIAHLLGARGDYFRITPSQSRAARQLLGIRAIDLAAMSGVSLPAIKFFEQGRTVPREATVRDLRDAFEARGVVFSASVEDAALLLGVTIARPIAIA